MSSCESKRAFHEPFFSGLLVWLDGERKRLRDQKDLEEAIVHGAVKRVRPKMMTVTTEASDEALLPITESA